MKKFGGDKMDWGKSIYPTRDGGYVITGGTYSFEGGNQVYLIKMDANGKAPVPVSDPFEP